MNIHSFVDQICHTHLKLKFKELQDRRPIVFDPALVRAAQLADIHLLNEAKVRGNDMKFLVQMYTLDWRKVSTNSFEAEFCLRSLPPPNKSVTISVHLE